MEKDDDQFILQGFEIGLGWTLALDRTTGNARMTFAGWDSTFIIFAACTVFHRTGEAESTAERRVGIV